MLRLLVLILLLANAVYLAWGQGWLLAYGWGPAAQGEPDEKPQHVPPEALVLIGDASVVRTLAARSALDPALCLRSGLLNGEQAAVLRKALEASWPADAWVLENVVLPERWIIYMGKFANAAELAKKRTQLDNLSLTFYPLGDASLAPGLSLGVYPSQQLADEALDALKLRGVRTARVLQDTTPDSQAYRLRLPSVDAALQKQLASLKPALADKALEPCPAASTQSP